MPGSSSAVTTWGGIYTLDFTNLPIYTNMSTNFEFARLNSFKFDLMPRANVETLGVVPNGLGAAIPQTIVIGVDEVPMSSTAGNATTWLAATSEDSGVSEAHAQACVYATPDYIRGMEGSKEVSLLKRVTKSFVPATYVITPFAASSYNSSSLGTPSYMQLKKKWFNTQVFSSSAQAYSSPVFWGLMYAFTGAPTQQFPTHDVRIHYSISFKRLRGG